jgi:hypothetical protein
MNVTRPTLAVGRSVDVPDLQTPRAGAHGGVVVQLREDAALVEMHRGGRHWFALDRLRVFLTPEELVAAYQLRRAAELDALEAEAGELVEDDAPAAPLVVIPCGGAKLESSAPAGELYTGAQHRLARQAGDVLAAQLGARVMILSARHGLVDLDQVLAPYDVTVGDPGAVTRAQVAAQLAALGVREVHALTPRRYSALLESPGVEFLVDYLAGSRGLLEQRARLAKIKRGELVAVPGADRSRPPARVGRAVTTHTEDCDDEGCYCPDDVFWRRLLGDNDPCAPGKDWAAAAFGDLA